MATTKVLVVEDEVNLLEAVKYNLGREGYTVLTASDGQQGWEFARAAEPDLVILDIMLPKLDGLEVCRMLRKQSDVPVLMLTAKTQDVDRVVGLEVGADDYVSKPFSMRELMARVRALLRRARTAQKRTDGAEREIVMSGDLEVDTASHVVRLGGLPLELKPREFQLLALLMSNKGRVLTRDHVLERLWGHDYIGDSRTVDVHIRWLREKIETDPATPRRIATVRGVGYRFEG
ncbi:MAG: response regulator transcription factor [SAR202 cluster bacterium]|nr:response regulator transcription factor [SAR202 cluster bacterium]